MSRGFPFHNKYYRLWLLVTSPYRKLARILKRIKYLAQWIKMLHTCNDYDYGYLLKIMSYQLTRMRDHTLSHAMHDDAEKTAKQMDECLLALADMQKDETELCEKEQEAYDKRWGKPVMFTAREEKDAPSVRITFKYDKVKTKKQEKQRLKELKQLIRLGIKRKKQANKKFLDIFLKNYQSWWC